MACAASNAPAARRTRRQRAPRLALGIFVVIAALAEPVRALEDPFPAQITPPSEVGRLPSSIVIDDTPAPITARPEADSYLVNHRAAHELRLRHRRLRKRQNNNDEDQDEEEDNGTERGTDNGSSTEGEAEGSTRRTQTEEDSTTEDSTRREAAATSTETEGSTKSLTQALGTRTTESLSIAPSTTATEPAGSESPLPVPFDNTPISDFATQSDDDSSCPRFITSLLRSKTFSDCYPLSLMVKSSTSFFDAKRQLTSMVRVLDATCAADVETCSNFMTTAAQNLTAEANCKEEYDANVSIVMEAHAGLMNYRTMYTATCLQDPDSNQYCYAGAVTNTSSATDSYLYYLPYDLSLPASATPSCSWCNQETMDIFHAASANRDLLISKTYVDAARIFNNWCDSDFVNSTLPDPSESAATSLALPRSWVLVAGTTLLAGALGLFL